MFKKILEKEVFKNINEISLYTFETRTNYRIISNAIKLFFIIWVIYFKLAKNNYFLSDNYENLFYWPFYILTIPSLCLGFWLRKCEYRIEIFDSYLRVVRWDFRRNPYVSEISLNRNSSFIIRNMNFEFRYRDGDRDRVVLLPIRFEIFSLDGDIYSAEKVLKTIKKLVKV